MDPGFIYLYSKRIFFYKIIIRYKNIKNIVYFHDLALHVEINFLCPLELGLGGICIGLFKVLLKELCGF